jgi:hypothetical protein
MKLKKTLLVLLCLCLCLSSIFALTSCKEEEGTTTTTAPPLTPAEPNEIGYPITALDKQGVVYTCTGTEYHVSETIKGYSSEIVIPDYLNGLPVTIIEEDAFDNCTRLTKITVGNCVKTIEVAPFSGCSALTTVTFPTSLTNIAYYTFTNANNVSSITYQGTINQWRRIGKECYRPDLDHTDEVIVNCTDGSVSFYG